MSRTASILDDDADADADDVIQFNDDDILNQIEQALRGEQQEQEEGQGQGQDHQSTATDDHKHSSAYSRTHNNDDRHRHDDTHTTTEQQQQHRLQSDESDKEASKQQQQAEAAEADDEQRSRVTATKRNTSHLQRHHSGKRKYMEIEQRLRKEEDKRNKLLLQTLPHDTAKRYDIHLNSTFQNTTVKKILSHYYLFGTGHTKQQQHVTSLVASIMKTVVMYIIEYARELQLNDIENHKRMKLNKIDDTIHNTVKNGNDAVSKRKDKDRQHHNNDSDTAAVDVHDVVLHGLNEVYDVDSIDNELQRLQQLHHEYENAQEPKPSNGVDIAHQHTNNADDVQMDGHETTPDKANGDATPSSDQNASLGTHERNDNERSTDNEASSVEADKATDKTVKQVEPTELGAIPPYYIRLAYLRFQQQGILPSLNGRGKLRNR